MAATVVQTARDLRPQADVDMASNGLVNLRAPTNPNDSARKADVDTGDSANATAITALSSATTTALATKAPLTSPTFSGTATADNLLSNGDTATQTLHVYGTAFFNNVPVTGVGTPTQISHAANKAYVDATVQGLQVKPTATVATTAALPANTYANGFSGVGATITITANGTLTIDGHVCALGDLVLPKNEATAANNGLYVVTNAGGASTQAVLTRHVDMDQAAEFAGAMVLVASGTANAGTFWLANPSGTVTVGTTAIPFSQVSAPTAPVAGTGISVSGNTITNAGVLSVAGRTGAVMLAVGDVSGAAPLASPTFNNGIGIGTAAVNGQWLTATSTAAADWNGIVTSQSASGRVVAELVAGSTVSSGGQFDFRAYGESFSETLFGNSMSGGSLIMGQANGHAAPFGIGNKGPGYIFFGTNNLERGRIDSSGAWSFTGSSTLSSGNFTALNVNPTINQSGTASSTIFTVNGTYTAVGSGPQKSLDIQKNSNSLASFDNNANLTSYGTNTTLAPVAVPTGITASTVGTPGTSTVSWIVRAHNAQSGTMPSATVTLTTANAVLSSSNRGRLTIPAVNGATDFDVWRTAGGPSQQWVGNVAANGTNAVTFDDIGQTGSATPAIPTSVTGTGLSLQAWTGQTKNQYEARRADGSVGWYIDANGNDTPENRKLLCQEVKPSGGAATVAAGASYTIFDSTVNGTIPTGTSGVLSGPGNVERIEMAITGYSDADGGASYGGGQINVYYDGETSPSLSVTIDDLAPSTFMSNASSISQLGVPYHTYQTAYMGMPVNHVFSFGFHRTIFIPWTTSCKVTYTNNSPSQAAGIWTEVRYRQGVIPANKGGPGTRRGKLLATILNPGNVAAYATVNTGTITPGVPGEIESLHMSLFSIVGAQTPYFFEGHPIFTFDGVADFDYGGTEDLFNGFFYDFGENVSVFTSNGPMTVSHAASPDCVAWLGPYYSSIAFSGTRLFGERYGVGSMPFDTSFSFAWSNGLSSVGGSSTVQTRISVLYYVRKP